MFRLEVIDPGGKTTTKEGDSTLAIDLADAKAGRWQFRRLGQVGPRLRPSPPSWRLGHPRDPSDSTSAKTNPVVVTTGGNVRFELVNLGNKKVVTGARPLRIAVGARCSTTWASSSGNWGTVIDIPNSRTMPLSSRRSWTGSTYSFSPAMAGQTSRALTVDNEFVRARARRCATEWRPEILEMITQTLDRFVRRGGTLYVSDLQYGTRVCFSGSHSESRLRLETSAGYRECQKDWLRVVAPLADAKTVVQTLNELELSDKLLAHRDELLAVIYTSALVRIEVTVGHARRT